MAHGPALHNNIYMTECVRYGEDGWKMCRKAGVKAINAFPGIFTGNTLPVHRKIVEEEDVKN
jgi:hypothetical protein